MNFDLSAILSDFFRDPARFIFFLIGILLGAGFIGWLWSRSGKRPEEEVRRLRRLLIPFEELAYENEQKLDELHLWLRRQIRDINPLRIENENLREEAIRLHNDEKKLRNETELLRGRVIKLRGDVEPLQGEVKKLRGVVGTLENQVECLRTEEKRLHGENKKLSDTVTEQDRTILERDRLIQERAKQYTEIHEKSTQLSNRLSEFETDKTNLNKVIHDLRQIITGKDVDLESKIQESTERILRCDQLTSELKKSIEAVGELKNAYAKLESKLKNENTRSERLQKSLDTMNHDFRIAETGLLKLKSEKLLWEKASQGFQTEVSLRDEAIGELKAEVERLKGGQNGKLPPPPLPSSGRLWEKPIRPLATALLRPYGPERRTPIISILNLKGGVGKTTFAVNLAANLWRQNPNETLLIDLDFQGSLTARCLSREARQVLKQRRCTIEYFMENPAMDIAGFSRLPQEIIYDKAANKLLVPRDGKCWLLGADEPLADADTTAMLDWIQNPDGTDVRFRLGSILHHREIQSRFAHIIIDCPPHLSTSCVNALACSDGIVIPVLPDSLSTERVPLLLTWIRRLRVAGVCPHLKMVSVVANRFSGTQQQKQIWKELQAQCNDCWPGKKDDGTPHEGVLHFCATQIHQDSCFAEAALESWPAVLRKTDPYESIRNAFRDLWIEIKGVLDRP